MPRFLKHMVDVCEADQFDLIASFPHNLRYIKNPTDAVIKMAVQAHGHTIKYVNNPSEDLQWIVINGDLPSGMKHVAKPASCIIDTAVRREARAASYFEAIPEYLQIWMYENQSPASLTFVKNVSESLQRRAIDEYGERFLNCLGTLPEDMKLYAIEHCSTPVIHEFIDPSETLQLAAVQKDTHNLIYINSPTKAVQEYVLEHDPDIYADAISRPAKNFQRRLLEIDPELAMRISKPVQLVIDSLYDRELTEFVAAKFYHFSTKPHVKTYLLMKYGEIIKDNTYEFNVLKGL